VRFSKFNASRCLPKSDQIFLCRLLPSSKNLEHWNNAAKSLIYKAKCCSKSLEQVGTKFKKLEQTFSLTAKNVRVTLGTSAVRTKTRFWEFPRLTRQAQPVAYKRAHTYGTGFIRPVGAKKSPGWREPAGAQCGLGYFLSSLANAASARPIFSGSYDPVSPRLNAESFAF
jgi:hypothetical protein